jgi:hemolysin activation/secretion protein
VFIGTGRSLVKRIVLAAIALTSAAALSTVAPSAAQAAPAGCVIDIGQPGDYYYQGVKAGEIEQQFDTCVGDANYHKVMAHWQWSAGFQSNPAYANVWVTVATGSPALEDSTEYGDPSSVRGPQNVEGASDDGYDLPGEDRWWRAGAELEVGPVPIPTLCVQWGSLHNYATGSELNGPVGGCGSDYVTAPY